MGELAVLRAEPARARRERVRLDRIEVTDRIRAIDPDWVEALAADMEKRGPVSPIELRPLPGGRLRLVHGAHRLAAYTLLGWTDADVDVLDQDALTARGREISENLMRRELSPLDRAAFLAELYEIERQTHGWEAGVSQQSYAVQRRWAKHTGVMMASVSGLSDSVAAKVGLSASTLKRDLELHRGLTSSARAMLAGTDVPNNGAQLRLLSRQPADAQARIAKMIRDGGARSVADAVAQLSGKIAATPEAKRLSAFIGSFQRMSVRERRAALAQLEEIGLPRGVVLQIAGADA